MQLCHDPASTTPNVRNTFLTVLNTTHGCANCFAVLHGTPERGDSNPHALQPPRQPPAASRLPGPVGQPNCRECPPEGTTYGGQWNSALFC